MGRHAGCKLIAANLGVLKSGKADLQTASRQTPTFNHTEIGGTGSTGKGGCQTGYLGMYCSCSEEIRKFGEAFDEESLKSDFHWTQPWCCS
ncbi:MAG: hypothetical protein H6925_01350 [Holosporaceae bacterium]|nr:MAG: hypothetical protein H6925_01350 [Holosporaceae bacterium]